MTQKPDPGKPEGGSGFATQIFRLSRRGPAIRTVRSLVPIFLGGGVLALPTDAVYGLSASFDVETSRKKITTLKGGGGIGAMLSLVSGVEMAFRYVEPPHGSCRDLLLRHWPGPMTAVLRARSHIPTEFCGPGDTLAFRWPSSPFLQALLGALGVPLLSTSANQSGEPTPVTFAELEGLYLGRVEAIVDGGDLPGEASTIVDLTGRAPAILRPGALHLES